MKIGVDLGGSHVAVGIVNNNLEIIEKIEENLTNEEKLQAEKTLVLNIEKKILKILEENSLNLKQIEQIGIACPGTVNEGKIYKASNLGLKNFPLQSKLQEKLQYENIKIRNDAKCAALAEMKLRKY